MRLFIRPAPRCRRLGAVGPVGAELATALRRLGIALRGVCLALLVGLALVLGAGALGRPRPPWAGIARGAVVAVHGGSPEAMTQDGEQAACPAKMGTPIAHR